MNRKKILDVLLWCSIAVYACMMAYLLMFKYVSPLELFSPERYVFRSVNLVPLRDTFAYLFGGITSMNLAIYNVFGNILIFVPLGLLIQMLRPKQPAIRTIAAVCVSSLAVEALQFILGVGSTDVDDVILNTLGGALGVLLFLALRRLLGSQERVKAMVSVSSVLCAVLVIAVFGRMWAFSIYREQIRETWAEEYGMELSQADISGIYQDLKEDTVIVRGSQEGNAEAELSVNIGPETKICIVRRTQDGDIDTFEPIDQEFFAGMLRSEKFPVWIELDRTQDEPTAEKICVGDRYVETEDQDSGSVK